MTQQDRPPVLRRKAAARRAAQGVTEVTAEKAMSVAAAHAGDSALGVAVTARDLTCESGTAEEMTREIVDPALYLRLTSPDGAAGVVALCPAAVAAAIEAQLLGAVGTGEAPSRPPTDTDAALLRDFVGGILRELAGRTGVCQGLPRTAGFSVADRLPDARAAAMTLAEAVHERFTVTLEFARGSKSGTFTLILPLNHAPAPPDQAAAEWGRTLKRTVLSSSATLEARFARLHLPLAQVRGFEVGQVVPLAGAALDKLHLIGAGKVRLAKVKLGRSGAMRAVRLDSDPEGGPAAVQPRPVPDKGGTAEPAGDPVPLPVALDPGPL